MPDAPSLIDPLSARLPAFCVDWRFLLPLRRGARLLVAGDTGQAFEPFFSGLDVFVVGYLPRGASPSGIAAGSNTVIFDPSHPPFAARSFDVLALPFGLPAGFNDPQKGPAGLSIFRELLGPGGRLLVGAANRWSLWHRSVASGVPSHGRSSLARLLRSAGYRVERVYGAIPGLIKPAYLLPLSAQALNFFLQHRYSGKRARRLSFLLSVPFLPAVLLHFLPAYFLLAEADAA
jgi:SAM-dependent methyltransferase